MIYTLCYIFLFSSLLTNRIDIDFKNLTVRESLVYLLEQTEVNYIIDNHFEKNRHVFKSYKNKSVEYILDDLSSEYHFEYLFNKSDNFLTISAKRNSIKGYVLNRYNTPIEDVNIMTTNGFLRTNSNGYFYFEKESLESINFLISHVSYKKKSLQIPNPNFKETYYITLEDRSYNEKTEHVIGLPNILFRPIEAEIKLQHFVDEKLGSTDDAFQSIKFLPGISGLGEGVSNFKNRGTNSSQSLILFDNIPVYGVSHLLGYFSIFNPNALDKIQLHRGVYDSKFNGQTSSVIQIDGKHADYNQSKFLFGANSFSYYTHFEFPISKKISTLISSRHAFTNIINSNLYKDLRKFGDSDYVSEDYTLSKTVPDLDFTDVNMKVNYAASDKAVYSFSLLYSDDETRVLTTDLRNARNSNNSIRYSAVSQNATRVDNFGINFLADYELSSSINGALSYSTSKYNYENENEILTQIDSVVTDSLGQREFRNNGLSESRLNTDFEFQFLEALSIDAGFHYKTLSLTNTLVSRFQSIDTLNVDHYSVYINQQWKINKTYQLNIGFNQNHISPYNMFFFEPRASFHLHPSEPFHLKLSYGKFHQTVHQMKQETILSDNYEQWYISNDKNNRVTATDKYELSLSYEMDNHQVHMEFYHNRHKNLVNYHEFLYLNNEINYTEGTATGAELLMEYRVGSFSNWFSGSYLVSDVPVNDKYDFKSNEYDLKLMSSYDISSWSFITTFALQTGNYYQAPEVFNSENTYDLRFGDLVNIGTNFAVKRLPSIFTADIKVSKHIETPSIDFKISLSLMNVFNSKNIINKRIKYNYNRPYFKEIYMLGFTPVLQVEAAL